MGKKSFYTVISVYQVIDLSLVYHFSKKFNMLC